ncbi:histamine N-methyltransferase A-like [Oculina patagonica]
MTSFALASKAHYVKSLHLYRMKSGATIKNFEILQENLPHSIQRLSLQLSLTRPCINILSVGSGNGETDIDIIKMIKEELQKTEQGRSTKIFNRGIEPNEFMCGLYKAAIANLPSPLSNQMAEFDLRQQTFEEYKKNQKESMKFDMVQFIHSIYYVDIEQALTHCVEKELSDKGTVVCLASSQDLMHRVMLKQNNQRWHGKDKNSESYESEENIIKIANENGWKHEIFTLSRMENVLEI